MFLPLWLLRMCTLYHLYYMQCCMLEASLKIDIICQCLKHPQEATAIVHSNKKLLLECDFTLLLSHAMASPSVGTIVKIAKSVSWRKIWDGALEYGYGGTICVQAILREFSGPTFRDRSCHPCNNHVEDYFLTSFPCMS